MMSPPDSIDPDQIALGVQQPWAELIVRGLKTLEIRRINTLRRERILIYASKKFSKYPAAEEMLKRHQLDREELVYGKLVGSVEIVGSRLSTSEDVAAACVPKELIAGNHAWELAFPEQFQKSLDVRFLPYGVWFYPFKRKQDSRKKRDS
ncbi:MAG: ASCH domain-containing protein [Planctomycetaceae bacterium]|nr:ASCH domain-containing protein [Planctomycetaceae bacterium]